MLDAGFPEVEPLVAEGISEPRGRSGGETANEKKRVRGGIRLPILNMLSPKEGRTNEAK